MIVLSQRGWARLFASDPGVIGRTLRLNGVPYEIVGVMPPEFRGLVVLPPDYWAPLALLGQFRKTTAGKEDEVAVEVFGRLKHGVSPTVATAQLTAWAAGNASLEAPGGRAKTISLVPSPGTASPDLLEGLLRFSPLFFAFGLILMIGCANVANLLLARGVSRQREIGVRLSLGASRQRIIRQLLTESLLLALASAACGLAILRLTLEALVRLLLTAFPTQIAGVASLTGGAADWRVIVFLLAGAMLSTVLFGLAPALHTTRLELVRTMRGELTRDARPGLARHALIAFQVGASALLLICAAIFLRGAFAAAAVKPGVRIHDTVMAAVPDEARRAAILQAVTADPAVAAVAASWPEALRGALAEISAGPAETPTRLPVDYKFVSPEYFDVLGIDIVRGRSFSAAERSAGTGIAIVSQTMAARLWPGRDALGELVRLDPYERRGTRILDNRPSAPQLTLHTFAIVGVVRDVRVGTGDIPMTDASVYLPIGPESAGTSLTLRVRGDPDEARRQLMDRLATVDPAMGEIRTLRSIAERGIYVLRAAFAVAAVLGALALVLTVSGIFSVLSYLVEQRRQEIGVRMALGATGRAVAGLVLSQSMRPVVFGLTAGVVLAATLTTVLLATPFASQIGGVVHRFDAVAYTASVLCIVITCLLAALVPAARTARIDPIATLRQE